NMKSSNRGTSMAHTYAAIVGASNHFISARRDGSIKELRPACAAWRNASEPKQSCLRQTVRVGPRERTFTSQEQNDDQNNLRNYLPDADSFNRRPGATGKAAQSQEPIRVNY